LGSAVLWASDADQVLYMERDFSIGFSQEFLVQQSAGGGGTRQLGPAPDRFLEGLSADGKKLLVWGPARFLQSAPFPWDNSTPRRITVAGGESQGILSPDGNWIAYRDREEIFLQSLTGSALRRQLSVSGGYMLTWRSDGKEIIYLSTADRQICSVKVDPDRGEFAPAVPLFKVRIPSIVSLSRVLAVTHDRSRILFAQAVEQPESNLINLTAIR
jgi:hypothetical protein